MKQLIVDTSSAQQQYVDYVNAANVVSCYVAAINNVSLPALVTPPANYGNYATTFATAKLHAMTWLDESVPDFNVIPSSIVNFNSIIQQNLSNITDYLNQLQASPGNQAIIASLTASLNIVLNEIESCKQAIAALDNSISSYQQNISGDASQLSQLSAQIVAAEKVSQSDIDQLNAVVSNLQAIVDDRNKVATLDLLANIDEGIFLTVASVAVGIPFVGTAAILVGLGFGLSSLAFTTFVPLNNDPDYQQSLQDIQTQMNNCNTEIGMINTSVALLQTLANQFNQLVTQSSNVSSQIQVVLSFWEQQQSGINQLINDIDDILAKEDSDIAQALRDVQDASASWNALEDSMNEIKDVDYIIKVTPAYSEPSVQPA